MGTVRRFGSLHKSLLAAALVACGASVSAQTAVAPSGEGTAESPYRIAQLGNLVWMGEHAGDLDGDGHIISGLSIRRIRADRAPAGTGLRQVAR